ADRVADLAHLQPARSVAEVGAQVLQVSLAEIGSNDAIDLGGGYAEAVAAGDAALQRQELLAVRFDLVGGGAGRQGDRRLLQRNEVRARARALVAQHDDIDAALDRDRLGDLAGAQFADPVANLWAKLAFRQP